MILNTMLSSSDDQATPRKVFRCAVYGVCIKDHKILLIEQKKGPFKGKLDFPGGGIEFGESIEEALQRELKEEVAMTFHSCKLWDNLTSTTEVPKLNEKESYLFYQIGMIYQINDLHQIDELPNELAYDWYDLTALSENRCSVLLWKFLKKHLLIRFDI